MSFGFQFDGDEFVEECRIDPTATPAKAIESVPLTPFGKVHHSPAVKFDLEELLSTLPPRISYSKIDIPIENKETITLYKRDLFDARFQLINDRSDQEEDETKTDEFENSVGLQAGSNTDLVPGVYEGGFKTWECSIDLVASISRKLAEGGGRSWLKNKQITEIGCGTAMPTLFLLSEMLKEKGDCGCVMELCDFNEQVLRLVTLPNLLLTWLLCGKAAKGIQYNGELEITEELIQEFTRDLKDRNIEMRFFSGPWQSLHHVGAFDSPETDGSLVITSETIYSLDSLPGLLDTLKKACQVSLGAKMQGSVSLSIIDKANISHEHLCLVAAKMLYFGVGGGVEAFIREAKQHCAECKLIWKSQRGVARVVLEVTFP